MSYGFSQIACAELINLLNNGSYALLASNLHTKELASDLEKEGYKYTPAEGSYAGYVEPMFMIQNPVPADIIALAKKYGQTSFVLSSAGEQQMIFTNGPHKGKIRKGRGWYLATGREGSFTTINTSDGFSVRFALSF